MSDIQVPILDLKGDLIRLQKRVEKLEAHIVDLKQALIFALIWIMATSLFLVFAWLH